MKHKETQSMTYVVYENATTKMAKRKDGTTHFKSERAAKSYITRFLDHATHSVAESNDYFDNIERQVQRISAMTGKPFMESVNTPFHCSPASESYWSS